MFLAHSVVLGEVVAKRISSPSVNSDLMVARRKY